MRDPERIDRIIEKLRTAWRQRPDHRLTVLVWNIAIETALDPFLVTDETLERSLDAAIARHAEAERRDKGGE